MEMIDSPTDASDLFNTEVFGLQLYLERLIAIITLHTSLFLSFSFFLLLMRQKNRFLTVPEKATVLDLKDLRDISICVEPTNLKSCRIQTQSSRLFLCNFNETHSCSWLTL